MVLTKKRYLSILLSLAVMLSFIPLLGTTAHAATPYALYVGETRVTSDNANDVFGDGKVSFDRDKLTLTLKGYSYKGEGYGYLYCGIFANYAEDKYPEGLTIKLEGVNTVECTKSESTGVRNSGIITIKGSGTLNASGAIEGISSGDENGESDVTIESGTVNATATDNDDMSHVGICCDEFKITGGTVTASAKADDSANNNIGIWCNTATISGGKLTAAGATGAINNNTNGAIVKNAISGIGWTNVAGTEGKKVIPVSTVGQNLKSYKKVQFQEPPAPAAVTKVTVNVATVNAKAIDKAVKKAGTTKAEVKTIVLGNKVKKISKSTFKNYKKAKTLIVKTKKLKKSSVKGSLKGSKITKVKVQVGSKKVNKKFVKKYKKIFTKKNAGKKVKVTL